jgi:demethylmenaquinone methyltransferase/2-methoxy-6-polyprenyl-1,4-benzoquinol methylase
VNATHVHELFAGIARRYDWLNDVMSLGLHRCWKCRLVTLAGQPRDVLDLCCGTGDIARRLARRGGFDARVTGVDFTIEMLRIAAARTAASGTLAPPDSAVAQPSRLRLLTWVQADALRLPFADNSFEVVSVGYGLRNLADLEAGLREIHRVLRPGGKLLSLDFGKPESGVWRRLYFAHLRFWVPVLGRVLAGNRDAYAYILPSLENYPGQRGVKAALEHAGFADCGFEEFCGGAMAINYGRKSASMT